MDMSFLPPVKITQLHFGLASPLYTLGAQCMSADSTLGEICIPPLHSHSDLGLLSFWLLGGGVPTPTFLFIIIVITLTNISFFMCQTLC